MILYLDGNDIREIKEKAFKGLNQLKLIQLKNNKIKTIHPQAFNGSVSLEILKLKNNKIATIPSDAFESLKKLSLVDLEHNFLSNVTWNLSNSTMNETVCEFYLFENPLIANFELIPIATRNSTKQLCYAEPYNTINHSNHSIQQSSSKL